MFVREGRVIMRSLSTHRNCSELSVYTGQTGGQSFSALHLLAFSGLSSPLFHPVQPAQAGPGCYPSYLAWKVLCDCEFHPLHCFFGQPLLYMTIAQIALQLSFMNAVS
jgi:hypothetical protein